MQSVAPPDGVVVSENTRHLGEGDFDLRGLGPAEVKPMALLAAVEIRALLFLGSLARASWSCSRPSRPFRRSNLSHSLSNSAPRTIRSFDQTKITVSILIDFRLIPMV
jgi:hypothetical protein